MSRFIFGFFLWGSKLEFFDGLVDVILREVGINHRCFYIRVAQELFDRCQVNPFHDKVRGKGVAEGVDTYIIPQFKLLCQGLDTFKQPVCKYFLAVFPGKNIISGTVFFLSLE